MLKNDTRLAGSLIAQKADVNHVDRHGYTPLHWAANVDFGNTAMLELLLRAGANPSVRSKEGLRPFDLAIMYQHLRHQALLKNATVSFGRSKGRRRAKAGNVR